MYGIGQRERPFQPLPYHTVYVQNLIAQSLRIERGLNAMQVFNSLRHPMGCSGAGCANLQHPALHLDVEGENMPAWVGKHAVHQNVPEGCSVLVPYFTLVCTRKAGYREHRVMSQDELVPDVSMLPQCRLEPLYFQMALASKASP